MAGEKLVAARWLMRGTNTGPLQGNPPTGGRVTLPGADFIEVAGDKVRSVHGYFDQKTFVEQLGLQAIVVPTAVGPVTFGSSARVSSDKRIKPGAVSLTWIDARSDEEKREIRERSVQIVAKEMSKMPGFLGWLGSIIGDRMFTATAWDAPASAAQLLLGGLHKQAVNRALEGTLGASVFTGVWVPHHLNNLWVRCTNCGRMADSEQREGQCSCGRALPQPPPYW